MNNHTQGFKMRLGLFVVVGLMLFVVAIFIIGKQKNKFGTVFLINTTFHNVSGLQVGNNIRFSGVNIGTVDNMCIINDSTVEITMIVKDEVHKYIRSDSRVAIGSEGIIGDKLLIISQGTVSSPQVKANQHLQSTEPIEADEIIRSIQVTAQNAEVITDQLAQIMTNVNSGNGTLARLIQDKTLADNLNKTIINLKNSSKGLDENMTAAKHNFFLKGYFNKVAREEVAKKKIKKR